MLKPMTETSPTAGSRPILITEIEQFGGAERSVLALARWLHQRDLPCHIVTYADHCNLAQFATHPLPIVQLRPGTGVRRRITALRRYFRSLPAGSPHPLASGYQAALHATLAGVRGFHTLMHDTPSLFSDAATRTLPDCLRIAVSNRIIAHGLRSGGNTIVTSQYLRAECHRDFHVEAHIARMGGLATSRPASLFRIRPIPPGGPLRMLSVCRIEASKRIDWLLRALAELEATTPPLSQWTDWQLDVAGSGPQLAPLRELAAQFGLGDRVHFHGFVPDSDLQALYDQTHLFLMPALQGYGIPAIESLQRGIPVLLHRDSGVSDILLETPWATVLTGGPKKMAAALASAIDGVLDGRHHAAPQPHLPTEDEWASQVARLCAWVS
jgi:glycosyltransferase involved in cell wall biosynthesis